ncbi:MAG: hypothetical protein MJZ42_03855 [Bacteroidales bacterium]|nr:hypothetical protein [Bacteroidales bacterium]
MNVGQNDIDKMLPFGEMLRGFVNQSSISNAEIHRILKERGIFALNNDKSYTVPILQTLLLSPKEFEEVRLSLSEREDNEKKFSREIELNQNVTLFHPDCNNVEVSDFLKKNLPSCVLKYPIRFTKVDDNPEYIIADFTIIRYDRNKSWYEQKNEFNGRVEFINENGKGHARITHTAPETKEIAEQILKQQVRKFKEKGIIAQDAQLKKIIFSEFSNNERFAFFYRMTTHLQNDYFTCENIKDISIKPDDDSVLPEEINWMDNMKKILLSGDSLNDKFFMKDTKYHNSIILWNMDALFSYNYKGEKGKFTISLGFPDYPNKFSNAEFEMNISQFSSEKRLSTTDKNKLKSKLLSEMDRQKNIVYNNFLEYLKQQK